MAEDLQKGESLQLQIAEDRVAQKTKGKDNNKYDEYNPKPPSKSVLMKMYADLSKAHDAIYAAYQTILDTDDRILRDKGSGTRDYYDLMIDSDSVLAGLVETRISAVAGLEWEIQAASEDDYDIMLADFVKFSLDKIGNFESALTALLGACVTGYAVSEIVWQDEVYEGAAKIVPRFLISRRPERFRFDRDYNLRLLTLDDQTEGVLVPPYKFIVHSFHPRYANPYGVSLMRAVWWSWWFKHHAFKWWLQAAERGAVLTPVGYYPQHFTPAERTEFSNALESFIGNKFVAAMEGSKVEFPQIKIDHNFCRGLVDSCDEQMRSRILGSTLSSGTAASGTRALGQVHDKRLQERIELDAKELMATINDQLIRWTVFLNFPEPDKYPKFKMKYEPPRDMKQLGETIKLAAQIGIPISVRDAADLLSLPLADEGEDLIVAPQTQAPMTENPNDEDTEEDEDIDDEEPEDEVDEDAAGFKLLNKSKTSRTSRTASSSGSSRKRIKKAARSRVSKRTKKYRSNAENLVRAAEFYGEAVYMNFGVQIQKWLAKYGNLDVAFMNVNMFDLNESLFAEYLTDANYGAAVRAYHDVYDNPQVTEHIASRPKPKLRQYAWQVTKDAVIAVTKMAAPKSIPYEEWKPIPAEDTIKRFSDRGVMTRDDFDALLDHERRVSFTAARMSANTIERKLRPAMLRALNEGTSLREFQKQVDGIVISQHHAENIYRTNLQTAYNNGHAEAIFSPDLAPVVPAFEFDAILDNRTTDICESRNGQVYSRQDMEWQDVIPPCHFQCRSTITEVFVDEWDGKISPPPTVDSMQGFGRWQSTLAPRQPGPSPVPVSMQPKPLIKDIPAIEGKPIIQGKKPYITAGPAPPASGEYLKSYKTAPDKLPGTSVRAQRAFPQYSKEVGKTMTDAANISAAEGIETGGAIRESGKMLKRPPIRGEAHTVNIPTENLLLGKQNATFHTHPGAVSGSFSTNDVGNVLSSFRHKNEIALTKDYVHVMRMKKGASKMLDSDYQDWVTGMNGGQEVFVEAREKIAIAQKGYFSDNDFENSLHDFWVEAFNESSSSMKELDIDWQLQVLQDSVEYFRIPVTEYEGLDIGALTFMRGYSVSGEEAKNYEIIDDSKLYELFTALVDYVEVYE